MNKVMTVFKMPLTTKKGVQVSIDKRLLNTVSIDFIMGGDVKEINNVIMYLENNP